MPKSLKIGFVFDDTLDSNDGVAQYVKTLGAWLADNGHEVSYLVGASKINEFHGGKVFSLAKNLRVNFNSNQLSIPYPAKRKDIKNVLETERFDLLHIQVPYSPMMAQKVIKLAPPHVAIVGTFHILPAGPLSEYGSYLLRLVYGSSLSRFEAFISVSPPAAAFARSAVAIQSEVIPNVVDLKKFAEAGAKTKPRKGRIVFLGRLVKRKGCEELIRAFSYLKQTHPEATLVIGGSGPQMAELRKQTRELGLKKSVEFLGFVEESQKAQLLASAQIACFPSLYGESFGIVLIEAMAAGAGVVVGGNNPGYASVLGEKPHLLVNPNDSLEFAQRLASLLDDRAQAENIHAWQQKTVKQYDVHVVGARLLGVYNQAIAKATQRGHN